MEPMAEARGRAAGQEGQASAGQERMLESVTETLAKVHHKQVHRAPWPDFDSFERSAYPAELRREAAIQWAGRACAEHGSVHQFAALTHALCEARAPLHILGALTRLQTDEVRHAELCAAMARACYPEGLEDDAIIFAWPTPRAPWRPAPRPLGKGDETRILEWAARVITTACCLGEALSKPMLDAIALVATDTVCEAVARQILRDEHLHASFGFETLGWLLPRLDAPGRESVQTELARSLGAFERTTACGITVAELAESRIDIRATGEPNLGTLTDHQYAMIFYATLEHDIFPKLSAMGLDPARAWELRGTVG